MGKGKRVRVIGRLEYQTWNDKTTGELRSRAVIVASQVLFLDYDRAHTGLAEEPVAEETVPVEGEEGVDSGTAYFASSMRTGGW